MREKKKGKRLSRAMLFIVLFGLVSMLSDVTHEGASSIQGAYLSIIGASSLTIGFISGFGELLGYSLRLLFGRVADKTKKYWPMVIIGYLIDTLAVPLLAFVGPHGWIYACIILSVERVGKAIKKPAKDTVLSFAAKEEKVGRSFALQEVLDQIGAFLGPLFLFLIMLFKGNDNTFETYALCFLALLVPALLTIGLLFFVYHKFPHPDTFEKEEKKDTPFKFRKSFLFYMVGIALFAFSFVDYSLVSMHVSNNFAELSFLNEESLPLLYSYAMLVDALSALFFGRLFDRKGVLSLAIATFLSSFSTFFIFGFPATWSLFLGVALWGIGMGAEESILKAMVTSMVDKSSRATGYGIFEFSFGIAWFLGSTLMGFLYDWSLLALLLVSTVASLSSIPFYFLSAHFQKKEQLPSDKKETLQS